MSDGINELVQSLQDKVRTLTDTPSFRIRGLELTPTGIYIKTASSIKDSQYQLGIGNCIGDLETPPKTPTMQPRVTAFFNNRGITRPIP